MSEFQYPPIYNFPPFYTKQPNLQTWQAQLQQWIDLIASYCKFHRIWIINSEGIALSSDNEALNNTQNMFSNTIINRSLKNELIAEIFGGMIDKGMAEYVDKKNTKSGLLVYWNKPEDWASIILEYVERTGQTGSILTLYELQKSEMTNSEEFHNIDTKLLLKALDVLVKRGRGQILKDDDGLIGGVKIV